MTDRTVARQQLRSVGARTDQNLHLAGFEHGLKVGAEKAQIFGAQRQIDGCRFAGPQLILANPLSSSNGRATLATLSCVNRKTVSCAALVPVLRTST